MTSVIDYKMLKITDPLPHRDGGELIIKNFITVADYLENSVFIDNTTQNIVGNKIFDSLSVTNITENNLITVDNAGKIISSNISTTNVATTGYVTNLFNNFKLSDILTNGNITNGNSLIVSIGDIFSLGAYSVTSILNENNLISNSPNALATQSSIKTYVDTKISNISGIGNIDIISGQASNISGSQIIDTVDNKNSIKWHIFIYDTTLDNFRSEEILFATNGIQCKYNEITTESVGDTSTVTVSANCSINSNYLYIIPVTGSWNIKYIRQAI